MYSSSSTVLLLIIPLLASLLTWFATGALCRWLPHLGLVDIPNARSSHSKPTPRSGGLSFVIIGPAMTVTAALWLGIAMPAWMGVLLVGSFLIASVSLTDDRWHLPARIRFTAHLVSTLILLGGGGIMREVVLPGGVVWSLGWLGLPFTLLWVIGLTNAYNFMDGIDGLAAGQAVVTAATVAWLAHIQGAHGTALAMAILAGSVCGFLLYNWPPARLFMGDVGSAFLGFTFGAWAALSSGTQASELPFVAWVVVLSPFLFDTGVTLISRIIRGQRWYEAHREHFYQRLIRQGWSHRMVTSLYLGVAVFLGFVAVTYYGYGSISSPIFIGAIIVPLIGIMVLVRWVEAQLLWRPMRRHRSD